MKIRFLAKGREKDYARTFLFSRISILFFLFFAAFNTAFGQSSALSFSPISSADADIIAPGRGAEQWHNGLGSIKNPAEDNNQSALDVYYRFTWNLLEGPGWGEYHWDNFDGLVRNAINKGQKLSFGIMSCYPYGSNSPGIVQYDNGDAAYPLYLHQMMQNENYQDWKTSGSGPTDGYGTWVPNWNSLSYLERLKALHVALYDHINSSYYAAETGPHAGKKIAFKDVIFSIDIRGYGSWGEWHSGSIIDHMWRYPEGTAPTAATLKTIIDHHADVFTDHPLSLMISVFDAERLSNTYTPKEVGAYALERTNNWGPFGWRRDNWGATDQYLDIYLRDNFNFFGATGPFNRLIMDRWKHAPITGEPPGWPASLYGNCYFDDMERQVREYHATSVGNGNYGIYDLSDCAKENLRAAFKATGYRIILEGGSISNNIKAGTGFSITLQWKNTGIAPTYENWEVVFMLKDEANNQLWSGLSQFSPGARPGAPALLPSKEATEITDHFNLPASIPQGNYHLVLVVKDPAGYRSPLPLAIYGRIDDGSYPIKDISVVAADDEADAPVPPVASPAPTPPAGNCAAIQATIINTGGCDGGPVKLALSSATGTGPFDIVVNGITYNDVSPGASFTSISEESIWSTRPTPATDIDRPVELGVKFMSSEPGFIKGIRFFSANEIAGTYTGHLWTADGTLLANAEFQNVTANGWQQVLFADPVEISPGKVYIASYYTSAGIYAATPAGLPNEVSNGQSLTALGNDTEGGNAVYSYSGPGFPNNTYNASNYWVDVLFTKKSSVYKFTSITDAAGCNTTGDLQTLVVTPEPCVQQRSASFTGVVANAASTVSIKKEEIKLSNELRQNYPNPFGTETVISYNLAKAEMVNLTLYDMSGKLVKVLVNGTKEAGEHMIKFYPGGLSAGIYYYKMQTGNYSAVKKMVVQ